MWLVLFFIYVAVAGALYYIIEKKGIFTIDKFEDKVGLSMIVLLWPLAALSFAPWALARGIDIIEEVVEKRNKKEKEE